MDGGDTMNQNYEETSKILKALADPNRLKIIDILSCGEACACTILEYFNFTQPTLSHHMKILMECGLVTSRKEGTWIKYTLDIASANRSVLALMQIITPTEDCICKTGSSEKNTLCNK